MARKGLFEAVILRTMDIGEADRFIVLFTREAGRKAARAKAVRKTGSRLGGALLPFRHVKVEITATDSSSIITGAADMGDVPTGSSSYRSFVVLERGIELLLALTEDDEPLPEIFDLLLQFIRLGGEEDVHALMAFRLRLLHLLGFLPENDEDPRFASLDAEAQTFVIACTRIADLAKLSDLTPPEPRLDRFIRSVTESQLQRPLKSDG